VVLGAQCITVIVIILADALRLAGTLLKGAVSSDNDSMRRLWVLLLAGVMIGSLLPSGSAVMQAIANLHINDKLLHFLAYSVLASVPALRKSRSTALLVSAGLVGMGGLMEILQLFVPGRSCELLDGLADLGGVLCGFLVMSGLADGWGRFRRSAA
jgi:VanZ family protein